MQKVQQYVTKIYILRNAHLVELPELGESHDHKQQAV